MVRGATPQRGDIWWVLLKRPRGSEPGYRHPLLIVQSDTFNRSRIGTIIGAALTSNLQRAAAPGNVELSRKDSGLPRKSVINVSQLVTLDKSFLTKRAGRVSAATLERVTDGLRLVLGI